ncbi:MAG: hypothetical protein WCK11_04500 [Candidatus Falkowbacteria bacterium]
MTNKLSLNNIWENLLIIISLLIITSGLIYRVWALNWPGIVLSWALTLLFFIIIAKIRKKLNCQSKLNYNLTQLAFFGKWRNYTLFFLYFFLWLITATWLWQHQSVEAIATPWQVVSTSFFIAYFFLTSLLFLTIWQKAQRGQFLILTLHVLLSISIINLIYGIGYGYDFFVHGATLDLIDRLGQVLPKTNYYMGQYGVLIVLHKTFFIPLNWLHRWLTPSLGTLLILPLLWRTLQSADRSKVILGTLLCLLLPYQFLTFSTPQNLAYIFLMVTVLFVYQSNTNNQILSVVTALAAIAIHPLAGLPALLIVGYIAINNIKNRKFVFPSKTILILLNTFALPCYFFILNNATFTTLHLPDNIFKVGLALPNQANVLLNLVYFWQQCGWWLWLAAVIIGFVRLPVEQQKKLRFWLYFFLSTFIAATLIRFLPFSFVVTSEQSDFANRVQFISLVFTLPLILEFIRLVTNSFDKQTKMTKIILTVFFSLCITANLYFQYPRVDAYANSKGYATSKNDLLAVEQIHQESLNIKYVVLANQQVSAAALSRYGFYSYLDHELFYYPVPTASPLYQKYLDMVYGGANRQTMNEAMSLAGVNKAYFILNRYWYAFPKVLAEAKNSADSWQSFGNQEVFIFRYTLAGR